MKCYIVERTEQEALSLKEEALKKGLIKKAGEIKKICTSLFRKDKRTNILL